jgi:hypothetical protein
MLGCGNSKLSEDVGRGRFPDIGVLTLACSLKMWEDGYCNIVNIDVSRTPSARSILTRGVPFSILEFSLNKCRKDIPNVDQTWNVLFSLVCKLI